MPKARLRYSLILILLFAFALRVWNLGTQSLWHDEAWSVFSAYHPLAWGMLGTDPNAPPVFYMTLSIWQHIAGDSVWAMRYWSMLVSMITIAVLARITRRWFGDLTAILAALLVAACPILWVFSQEIRAYTAMPLLAILLLAVAYPLLKQPTRRAWLWILVMELITLYTHNLSVPIIAWLNITLMAIWFFRRDWQRLAIWFVSQIGVGILYLPWLLTQKPTGTVLNTPPALNLTLIWNIWQSYFTGIKAMVGADSVLMLLTAILGVIAFLALVGILITNRRLTTILVISQAILIPVLSLIEILGAHIDFHPRYFIVGAPATMIVIALGLTALGKVRVAAVIPHILAVGTAGVAIAIMLHMMQFTYSSPLYQHDDFRSIAERYAKLGPDDRIIIPYGWEPTLDYYGQEMGFKDKIIGVPLYSSADTIISTLLAALQGVKHAELLTWYQLPADVKGAYPCLLGSLGQPTEQSLTVEGLRTDSYDSFSNRAFSDSKIQFERSTPDVRFGPIQLLSNSQFDQTGYWGFKGLCVISHWTLWQPASENLQLLATLVHNNDEIARNDKAILNDRQLPTTLWANGQDSDSFSFIPIPLGTAPTRNYDIHIKVYSPASPNGINYALWLAPDLGWEVASGTSAGIDIGTTMKPIDDIPPMKLTADDVKIDEGVYLHGRQIPTDKALKQGQAISLSLTWLLPQNMLFNPQIVLEGQGWQVSDSDEYSAQSILITPFHLKVPADAVGKATLKVVDGTNTISLADYDITAIDRTFTTPTAIQYPIKNATFTGIGSLIGLDMGEAQSSTSKVTLYWKPDETPSAEYTVFVHLLDANGNIIAQSDSPPVGGNRPTTNWLKDEIIADSHTITINAADFARVTSVRIGLYAPSDPEKRVSLGDGTDNFIVKIR